MRRFDALTYFLGQFREKLSNNIVGRRAVRVFGFEVFLADDAAFINVEEPRVCHALGHPLRFCIQHVKAADDVGIRIGQQRKFDVMTLGEISEDCWAVITDRSQFDALVVESCPCGLQLHELRFAKRSPVG